MTTAAAASIRQPARIAIRSRRWQIYRLAVARHPREVDANDMGQAKAILQECLVIAAGGRREQEAPSKGLGHCGRCPCKLGNLIREVDRGQ